MLAVIKTGGKQYKVAEGDYLSLEKLPAAVGETVNFTDVMLVENAGKVSLGASCVDGATVDGATVVGEVVAQKKRDTVLIFKKGRRKNRRRKNGHRQPVTVVKISSINC